jgi:hypothetical protein
MLLKYTKLHKTQLCEKKNQRPITNRMRRKGEVEEKEEDDNYELEEDEQMGKKWARKRN